MEFIREKLGCELEWFVPIVEKGYRPFDLSHGYGHIEHAIRLLHMVCEPTKLELTAIAVHDIIDPKYETVSEFTVESLRAALAAGADNDDANDVIAIITNMSWTAELAGKNAKIAREKERRNVQAADWLTSIGKAGLVKSYQYNRDKLGKSDPVGAVIDLYHSRLCKYVAVMSTGFGPRVAQIAAELHAEMVPTREFIMGLI